MKNFRTIGWMALLGLVLMALTTGSAFAAGTEGPSSARRAGPAGMATSMMPNRSAHGSSPWRLWHRAAPNESGWWSAFARTVETFPTCSKRQTQAERS